MPFRGVPPELQDEFEAIYGAIRHQNPSLSKEQAARMTWHTIHKMDVYDTKTHTVNKERLAMYTKARKARNKLRKAGKKPVRPPRKTRRK